MSGAPDAKRRRLSLRSCRPKMKLPMTSNKDSEQEKCRLINPNFESLPDEVLEMVLKFLSYRDIAEHVRLVSKKFSSEATTILNSAFLSAGQRLTATMKHLETAANCSKDALDLVMRGKALNYLEYVKAQYELLRAVVWRYTHPSRRQKFTKLCFYAGTVLDDLDKIMRLARVCPSALLGKCGPVQIILNFSAMCKKFMNHFEKTTERKVNKNTLVSGCKIVDLLDCLLYGRELVNLRLSTGRSGHGVSVSMKLRYVMERSWFMCLTLPNTENAENSWRDQQRFMYLRLRRMVNAINEHYLEKTHYERELFMQQSNLLPSPKPPPCSTYSGYGEYGGQFFYYGNMNEYAFDSKVIDTWRRNSTRDRKLNKVPCKKPCYDVVVNVELRCSPEFAPLTVRSMLNFDDIENTAIANNCRQDMYLKLEIHCPNSLTNKLPGSFTWKLKAPRH